MQTGAIIIPSFNYRDDLNKEHGEALISPADLTCVRARVRQDERQR